MEPKKQSPQQNEPQYKFGLPPPTYQLEEIFAHIKIMQKDNLNDIPAEPKDDRNEEEIKGLKFIAKKLKVLLEKNRKIQYSDASRILINNFANVEKDERNIKRRVYDAINVLVAAEVIKKDNNKIEWNNRNFQVKKPDLAIKFPKKKVKAETEDLIGERIQEKKRLIQKLKRRQTFISHLLRNKTSQKLKDKKAKKVENYHLSQYASVLLFEGQINEASIKKGKKKSEIELKGKSIKYTGKAKDWWKFLEDIHEII